MREFDVMFGTMRRFVLPLIILQSSVCLVSAAETSVAPTALPRDRYKTMIKKSPFAPATPTAAVAATPGFATGYYVAGVAKIGDKDFVTIASRNGQSRFSLMPGEAGPEGITVTSVQWSNETGKSKATVKKGNETGTIEFDQMAAQANAAPAPQVTQPGQPGMIQPPRMPNIPRMNMPQPPNYPQPPQTGMAAPNGQQPDMRRRIRIINNKPQ